MAFSFPTWKPENTELTLLLNEEKPAELNWERIPLIQFKYNKQENPLLTRVKSLQDGINAMLSDFIDEMRKNPRNTILVLNWANSAATLPHTGA